MLFKHGTHVFPVAVSRYPYFEVLVALGPDGRELLRQEACIFEHRHEHRDLGPYPRAVQ